MKNEKKERYNTIFLNGFLLSGDQLRFDPWRCECGHGKRRRDRQLSTYTGRGASRLGKVLVHSVERGRVQRGRARSER